MKWYSADSNKGVVVNVSSKQDFFADMKNRLSTNQGFTIATLNLDHVVKLSSHGEFRTAYEAHSHVTADGNPIIWLSKLAGHHVELLPGSELVEPLTELATALDIPVAFFGANAETLKRAEENLKARYPNLRTVAQISPPMGLDPAGPAADAAIIELQQAGARLVFLALGAPKQEIFAARAFDKLPQAGFLSVGAGLDFIAGSQSRAPQWAQQLALEWLWRLIHDPKRLLWRYTLCCLILPQLVWRSLRCRLRPNKS